MEETVREQPPVAVASSISWHENIMAQASVVRSMAAPQEQEETIALRTQVLWEQLNFIKLIPMAP